MSRQTTATPCITIWNPWCALIAFGFKPFENRPMKPPVHLYGKRMGLHAGKTYDNNAEEDYLVAAAITLTPAPLLEARMAIIAAAELVDCVRFNPGNFSVTSVRSGKETSDRPDDDKFRWWDTNQYGWVFRDPQILETPVLTRGYQGVWYFDGEL